MITAVVCVSGVAIWVLKLYIQPEPERSVRRRRQLRQGVYVCMQSAADRKQARRITRILRANGIEYSLIWAKQPKVNGAFITTGNEAISMERILNANENGYLHDLIFT